MTQSNVYKVTYLFRGAQVTQFFAALGIRALMRRFAADRPEYKILTVRHCCRVNITSVE